MSIFFILFWTVMIFLSVGWYAFLLFYVGAKGGKEIRELTRELDHERNERDGGGKPPSVT